MSGCLVGQTHSDRRLPPGPRTGPSRVGDRTIEPAVERRARVVAHRQVGKRPLGARHGPTQGSRGEDLLLRGPGRRELDASRIDVGPDGVDDRLPRARAEDLVEGRVGEFARIRAATLGGAQPGGSRGRELNSIRRVHRRTVRKRGRPGHREQIGEHDGVQGERAVDRVAPGAHPALRHVREVRARHHRPQGNGKIPRAPHVDEIELALVGAHDRVGDDLAARPCGQCRVLQQDQVVPRAVPAEHRDSDGKVRPGRAQASRGLVQVPGQGGARVADRADQAAGRHLGQSGAQRGQGCLGLRDVVPRACQSRQVDRGLAVVEGLRAQPLRGALQRRQDLVAHVIGDGKQFLRRRHGATDEGDVACRPPRSSGSQGAGPRSGALQRVQLASCGRVVASSDRCLEGRGMRLDLGNGRLDCPNALDAPHSGRRHRKQEDDHRHHKGAAAQHPPYPARPAGTARTARGRTSGGSAARRGRRRGHVGDRHEVAGRFGRPCRHTAFAVRVLHGLPTRSPRLPSHRTGSPAYERTSEEGAAR